MLHPKRRQGANFTASRTVAMQTFPQNQSKCCLNHFSVLHCGFIPNQKRFYAIDEIFFHFHTLFPSLTYSSIFFIYTSQKTTTYTLDLILVRRRFHAYFVRAEYAEQCAAFLILHGHGTLDGSVWSDTGVVRVRIWYRIF